MPNVGFQKGKVFLDFQVIRGNGRKNTSSSARWRWRSHVRMCLATWDEFGVWSCQTLWDFLQCAYFIGNSSLLRLLTELSLVLGSQYKILLKKNNDMCKTCDKCERTWRWFFLGLEMFIVFRLCDSVAQVSRFPPRPGTIRSIKIRPSDYLRWSWEMIGIVSACQK